MLESQLFFHEIERLGEALLLLEGGVGAEPRLELAARHEEHRRRHERVDRVGKQGPARAQGLGADALARAEDRRLAEGRLLRPAERSPGLLCQRRAPARPT